MPRDRRARAIDRSDGPTPPDVVTGVQAGGRYGSVEADQPGSGGGSGGVGRSGEESGEVSAGSNEDGWTII